MKASFWRKSGFSLAAGVILFGLRLMQNQTGFDPETGLALPNFYSYALIAALAAVLVLQLVLQRKLPRKKFSFAAAFTPAQQLKLPLVLGGMLLVYRLARLESFGVAYLTPFASNAGRQTQGHTVLRQPLPDAKTRPEYLNTKNRRNQR